MGGPAAGRLGSPSMPWPRLWCVSVYVDGEVRQEFGIRGLFSGPRDW